MRQTPRSVFRFCVYLQSKENKRHRKLFGFTIGAVNGQRRDASATYGTVEDQSGEDQVRPLPIEVVQQHVGEGGESERSEPGATYGDARR